MNYTESRKAAIATFEKSWVLAALDKHGGNVAMCAREEGIDRVYMHRLMRRHGIVRFSLTGTHVYTGEVSMRGPARSRMDAPIPYELSAEVVGKVGL